MHDPIPNDDAGLVSCIMPTADRRRFIPSAIGYFQNQDYPNKELVILDDGEDPIEDLVPDDPNIRYYREQKGRSLGAKRNRLCELARGNVIAHWDDDDWMAPWRLSYQMAHLAESGAKICGLDKLFFYNPKTDRAWQFVYPPGEKPWLSGGTLCFRKELWRTNFFPEINVGEDTRFIWNLSPRISLSLPDNSFYVALIHSNNSSPKRTGGAWWHSCSVQSVKRLMGGNIPGESILPDLRDEKGHPYPAPKKRSPEITEKKTLIRTTPRVTVTIPYFQCKPHIRKAVESILAQTYRELKLVVVNDADGDSPWDELAHIQDPRLVRFDLKSNRGRYFCDAVVLEATDDPYYMIQDADDWSEPDRIASLLGRLRAEHADGAVSTQMDHAGRGAGSPRRADTHDLQVPLDSVFKLRVRHHGLYRTDALRRIGGYYGGFRFAYDLLLINLLLMTGRLAFVDQPLYHRTVRQDSLSECNNTGMMSAARKKVTERLTRTYLKSLGMYKEYLKGKVEHDELCAAIRRFRDENVPADEKKMLRDESKRLKQEIDNPSNMASTLKSHAMPGEKPDEPDLSLIDDPRLNWTGWAISRMMACKLRQYLYSQKPKRILEIGSGTSTVLFADYAARHQAVCISLNYKPKYYRQTVELLKKFKLDKHVDLKQAALHPFTCPGGRAYPWYDLDIQGPFDFVFIDGPPLSKGRQATFFAVAPHLAKDWVVWLHDAARPHEKECVDLWQRYFDFHCVLAYPGPRGLFKLSSPEALSLDKKNLSGLGISILTGNRLNLLRRTVKAIWKDSPQLLTEAHVAVMVNGDDPQTLSYVEELPFVDQIIKHTKGVLPTGPATSRLMRILLEQGVETILHLEDDWEITGKNSGWFSHAQKILNSNPAIGQIRLRYNLEKVLPYHMITGKPIRWTRNSGFLISPSAHFTFNPSLVRARDISKIFPCGSEHEAQINFLKSGAASAQALPGFFCHIGGGAHRQVNRN